MKVSVNRCQQTKKSYLRGRACENLSHRVQTAQNTKVSEGGVQEGGPRAAIPGYPPQSGHEWFTACLCHLTCPSTMFRGRFRRKRRSATCSRIGVCLSEE